ncbi:hypothetical protein C6Q35_27825 [Burkholderia multivorans]|nr:hypothetical protein C6Q35_27825 [Burkholderia multivorans]
MCREILLEIWQWANCPLVLIDIVDYNMHSIVLRVRAIGAIVVIVGKAGDQNSMRLRKAQRRPPPTKQFR